MAENAALKQPDAKQRRRGPGRPWQPGQSGNVRGKAKGTRNRCTMLAERLLDDEAPALVRKAIELALQGDLTALRICLDRIVPPRRSRAVQFTVPPLRTAADASAAMAAVLAGVAEGALTPDEGSELSNLIANYVKVFETTALEQRIAALEKGSEVIELTHEELVQKLEESGLPTSIFGIDVPVLDLKAETEPVSGNGM
jgi:Family of unknown function (DUF5681)